MNTFAIADAVIAMAFALAAFAAIYKRGEAPSRKSEIRSALFYLVIASLLVVPLWAAQCSGE